MSLRVAIDANVLIAGTIWPRWPYEILIHALRNDFVLVLPLLVIEEAYDLFQQDFPDFLPIFEFTLSAVRYELVPPPPHAEIKENHDLMRDPDDIPIALSIMKAGVDYFVTYDRDYTDPGRTTQRIRDAIAGIMLPPIFLRDVMGWTSEQLEQIRRRNWSDLDDQISE